MKIIFYILSLLISLLVLFFFLIVLLIHPEDYKKEIINYVEGKINYDLAYGGAYYAIVDGDNIVIDSKSENIDEITNLGMSIKRSVSEKVKIKHPLEPDMNFLYGVIFSFAPKNKNNHRKHCVLVF